MTITFFAARSVLVLVLLLVTSPVLGLETNAVAGRAGREASVSVPLEFNGERLVIPAQVNGSNVVWLMLDTGFSISVIDPRLADLLQLRHAGKTTIIGVAGEEQADVFQGASFDFAGASYAPRRVAALPSDRKKRARRMEGILGAGFFRRFVVEIDFEAKTVELHEPQHFKYSGSGEALPFRFRGATPVIEAAIRFPDRPV